MQSFMNFARFAPSSFWSSAPNLQVSIFSPAVTAKDGEHGSITASKAATTANRVMTVIPGYQATSLALILETMDEKLGYRVAVESCRHG
jgi:hypothetical protein